MFSPLVPPVIHPGHPDGRETSVPRDVTVRLTLDQEDVSGLLRLLQLVEPVEGSGGALLPPELIIASDSDPVAVGEEFTVPIGVGYLNRRYLLTQRPYVTGTILERYVIVGEELQGEVLGGRIRIQCAPVCRDAHYPVELEIRIGEPNS